MKTFRALTTNVSVAIADDLPGAELARALIESYPPATSAELRYELDATSVRRNGEQLALADPADFVPLFEMDFYEQVGTLAAPGWLLHAAALDIGGRALVLCGPSGAGKTTLSLALAARGIRLLTEEMVWIDQAGTVRGLPRPLHVPERSAQRSRIPAGWRTLPYPIRDRAGEVRDNLLVIPPREALVLDALPLRAIVRIGHGPDWPMYLRDSPHHVALQRLWDRSLRQDDAGLEAATAVLREHGSFELSSSAEKDALALLEPMLK